MLVREMLLANLTIYACIGTYHVGHSSGRVTFCDSWKEGSLKYHLKKA